MRKKFFLCYVVAVMVAMMGSGRAHAGGFIKPNAELLTYRLTNNDKKYMLDYLMGLSLGYQTKIFEVMISSDYLWYKRALLLSAATDYQWRGDIARVLVGGQVTGQLSVDKKNCPSPCKLVFLFVPRLGFGFRIGQDSWLGLTSKVYLPMNKDIVNPYYGLALDTTIDF